MLIGEYRHTIDEKRRLAIPSKMRKQLGNEAVLTRGLDGCLTLYPTQEWKKESEKLSRIPSSSPEGRAYARIMLAGADQVSFDSLGRILVPEYLAQYATLQKNVVIGGLNTRLEIWDERKWDDYKKKAEGSVEDFASKLGDVGI
ncbi:MAG: division/cell wall cluster transcriptional repressor MraZ [bacterium]|nr:division/cell wall cluster transcriptional repressor MraZ [bacterium]